MSTLERPEPPHSTDTAAIVQSALELAADGRMADATVVLAALEGTDAAVAAADDLTDRCVLLLRRIRRRSRYPIPVHLVLARLEVPAGSDAGLCFTMLQRSAFRASGLDLDLEELVVRHGSDGVVFGAFHSTHALVCFTGERWWRTPRSILAEMSARRPSDALSEGGGW